MTRSTYIIGAPGSGKSTLMAELLADWDVGSYTKWHREVFGHWLERGDETGVYLGHLREDYPGTDALSLSAAPRVLEWLESLPLLGVDALYAEGMRLSHMSFLLALHEATDLTVIYVDTPPDIATARRLARGGKLLSDQFCKIATSKAKNVAAACRDAGIKVEVR